jgi:hypothetical protein
VGVIAQGAQGYLREIEMHKQRIAEDQQEKRKLHNTIQVTPTHAPRPRQGWTSALAGWALPVGRRWTYGVRVEIVGSQTCRIVGKSQAVLVMIHSMIFTRPRTRAARCPGAQGEHPSVLSLPVSRAFPSWYRCILTEIYLCHACSCHGIEDGHARPGRSSRWRCRRASSRW